MVRKKLNKSKRTQKKLAKKILENLKSSDNGDFLFSENGDFRLEMIFDNELQKLADDHFGDDGDADVSENQLQKYIFDEMQLQANRARASGKKKCRYSFLFLRFAIALQLKVGKDRYGWLSKNFNLPSKSTIAKYTVFSSRALDGILYKTLNTERIFFDEVQGVGNN